MHRLDHIDASDRGIRASDRSRQRATSSAGLLLPAVVALVTLVAASCTRPEDAAPADVSIPPVTDTSDPMDPDDSDDSEADNEPTDDTSLQQSTTTTPTTTSTSIAGGATTSTAIDTRPTTSATTTTPAARPDDTSDLTLTFDGVLPFRFGDRDVDVVPALTELLGRPTLDDTREYPVADQGVFLDANGEESFVARFGRTVCYADGLCLQFGAGAPETLIFTGWRVGDASSEFTTEDGLTIGSTLAEFADLITFDPTLACFQVVDGSAAGVDVTLLSDDGDFAASTPDPAAVAVIEMRAGQLPESVLADC